MLLRRYCTEVPFALLLPTRSTDVNKKPLHNRHEEEVRCKSLSARNCFPVDYLPVANCHMRQVLSSRVVNLIAARNFSDWVLFHNRTVKLRIVNFCVANGIVRLEKLSRILVTRFSFGNTRIPTPHAV